MEKKGKEDLEEPEAKGVNLSKLILVLSFLRVSRRGMPWLVCRDWRRTSGSQFLTLHHPGLKKLAQFHSNFPVDPFQWLHKAKFKCSSSHLFSLLLYAYLAFPSFWLSHCKNSIFPKCSSNITR